MQKTKTIKTSLFSTPTVSVPNNFTALHLAHISWNLYSSNAPTHYANEFSIDESSDFAHYNIFDSMDIAQHFFDCAFAIAESVRDNIDYSVQDAYYTLEEISADTVVRESVASMLAHAVESFVANTSDYNKQSEYILQDFAYLVEDSASATASQIAQLEKQLAVLKAKQSA